MSFLLIIVGILDIILGFIVLLKNKHKMVNRVFALITFCLAIWSFTIYLYWMPQLQSMIDFWSNATFWGPSFIVIFLVYFSYSFPDNKSTPPYMIKLILFIFTFLLFLLSLFNKINIETINPWTITRGFGIYVFEFYFIVGIFFSLFKLIKKYKVSIGVNKIQIKYVFIGIILSAIAGIIFNLVLPLIFNNAKFTQVGPPVTGLIFILIIAYAIIKHRFMDIRLIIKRTTVYASTIIFILIIALALYWLETNFFANSIPPSIWGPLVLLFSLIIYNPLRKYFERIANKYFFTSLYNYQTTLEELGKQLTATINLSEIVDSIINTIKSTMHLDRAGVLLYDKQSSNYKIYRTEGFTESNGISLVRNNFLTNYLIQSRKPVLYQELDSLKEKGNGNKADIVKLKTNMHHIEAHICLPLLVKNKLIGIIVLGQKISKDAYTHEDLKLLESLTNQASVAIENAKLYQEVQDFNKNLQSKVEDQTKDIKNKNLLLQKLLEIRSQFLDIASHQLRTPVSMIRGVLSMIRDGDLKRLPKEKQDQFIENAWQKGAKLDTIINDILAASELDTQKFQVDAKTPKIQLEEVTDKVVKDSQLDAEKRKIELKWQPPKEPLPKIKGYANFLEQAITNLVGNALKYTPSTEMVKEARSQRETKGVVEVSIVQEKENIIVKIKDNGIGIPKEEIPKLFDKFVRASNATAMYTDGSGLGLFIVKEIIEGHQGKVWVESDENKGSTFYVSLPVARD